MDRDYEDEVSLTKTQGHWLTLPWCQGSATHQPPRGLRSTLGLIIDKGKGKKPLKTEYVLLNHPSTRK